MTKSTGRRAGSPSEIGAIGWRDIAWRFWNRFNDNRLLLVSAGATFYLLLSIVPLLAIFVAAYGLVFDTAHVVEQMSSLTPYLPAEARSLMEDQLLRLVAAPSAGLKVTVVISLLIALWSASGATKAIIEGLNIVNAEDEERSFVKRNLIALSMTLLGVAGSIFVLSIAIALPLALERIAPHASGAVPVIANLVLAGVMVLGIGLLYRYGPSRQPAKWHWLGAGSVAAVLAIVAFTAAFGWYARNFAAFNAYGSLGTVIGFMTWAWICMVLLLAGAQLNAAIEHQTARDTTTGLPLPMGTRGAVMADTLGAAAGAPDTFAMRSPDRAAPGGTYGLKPLAGIALLAVAVALATR